MPARGVRQRIACGALQLLGGRCGRYGGYSEFPQNFGDVILLFQGPNGNSNWATAFHSCGGEREPADVPRAWSKKASVWQRFSQQHLGFDRRKSQCIHRADAFEFRKGHLPLIGPRLAKKRLAWHKLPLERRTVLRRIPSTVVQVLWGDMFKPDNPLNARADGVFFGKLALRTTLPNFTIPHTKLWMESRLFVLINSP